MSSFSKQLEFASFSSNKTVECHYKIFRAHEQGVIVNLDFIQRTPKSNTTTNDTTNRITNANLANFNFIEKQKSKISKNCAKISFISKLNKSLISSTEYSSHNK